MSTQLLLPPPLTDPPADRPYLADPSPRGRRDRVALVAGIAVLWAVSGLGFWVWSLVQPPTPCHAPTAHVSVAAGKAGCSPAVAVPSPAQPGSSPAPAAVAAPLVGRYPTSPTRMTMGASGTVTLPAGWVGFLYSSPTLDADVANAFPGHPDVVSRLLQMMRQNAANHETFVAMSNTGADVRFASIVAPNLSLAAAAQAAANQEIKDGAHDLKVQPTTFGSLSAVRFDSSTSVKQPSGATTTEHVILYLAKDSLDRFYFFTEHTPDLAHDQKALDGLAASVYIHGVKL